MSLPKTKKYRPLQKQANYVNIIQKVKNVLYIVTVKSYGILAHFTIITCKIWSNHMTQVGNFESMNFTSFVLNLRKVTQFCVHKFATSKIISKKTQGQGRNLFRYCPLLNMGLSSSIYKTHSDGY